jgi:hypothetical protein
MGLAHQSQIMPHLNHLTYTIANLLRRTGFDFHEADDARVQAMRAEIKRLGSLKFKIEISPDGSWAAESVNLDGIITGSRHLKDMNALLKDAIFTYFEIPPHLCNDTLLNA